MTRLWKDDRPPANPVDIESVHRLGKVAAHDDLQGCAVDNDDLGQFWWVIAFICLMLALVACTLGVIIVQIARHWVGLLQITIGTAVFTLLMLGIDWAIGAAARGTVRAVPASRNWVWPR